MTTIDLAHSLREERAFFNATGDPHVFPTDSFVGREIELNIRHVPGGRATTWVHQQLRAGDRVQLAGPYGRFFVRRSAHDAQGLRYLFLAGGSGLSSPRSMILDLLAGGCPQAITLVNGARSREELYHHAEFQALAAEHLLTEGRALAAGVHPVPPALDREVARLKLAALGVEIDVLTEAQRAYLGGWHVGT